MPDVGVRLVAGCVICKSSTNTPLYPMRYNETGITLINYRFLVVFEWFQREGDHKVAEHLYVL